MKLCKTCQVEKALSEFYMANKKTGVLQSSCKQCIKDKTRVWQQAHPDKVKEAGRKYKAKTAKAQLRYARQYRARNPDKVKEWNARNRRKNSANWAGERDDLAKQARRAVEYAVRKGELPPASIQTCRCGSPATEYHHYNGYAKENWFDVVALCFTCHGIQHRKV